jgi:hypothetical protein
MRNRAMAELVALLEKSMWLIRDHPLGLTVAN